MELKNRIAAITGATGGLGSVVTRELASRGARLILLDIDPGRLDALTSSLALPEGHVHAWTVNLLNPVETKTVAESAIAQFGRIDILLHLVGGWTGDKYLVEASTDDLAFMLNQHIWTTFHVLQAFVPHLVRNQWGRIVMISSPFAARPAAKGGPYAVGKAGQEALLMTLSQELKGTGVTANLLLAKTIDVKRERISHPTAENASWTTPEELTAGILYLLSDEAGTINGAKIPMYGSS